MENTKKFFERGWFTFLMLFMFFPLGVFLLWKYHRRHKILNVFLTLIFGFIFLITVTAIFTTPEALEERSRQDQAERDEAAQQQQMHQEDSPNTIDVSNVEPAQSAAVIGNGEETSEPAQQIAPDDDSLSETVQMYNDSEFLSYNFNTDVPDFSPFTSYEQRNLNDNEIYDRIDEAQSGLTYTYQNYDLKSDGYREYCALLESIGFTEIDNGNMYRRYTKDSVGVTISVSPPSTSETSFESAEIGIFYDYPAEDYTYEKYDNESSGKNIIINGDTITYTNDGFILTLPYNASLQSTILTEPVNQFSLSEGSNVPSEKIYEINISGLFYPVKLHIFENEDYNFDENNRINVPNADRAYLAKNVSDSILEESSYELEVLRDDLVYVISATYWPSWALTGQAQGQSDFSEEREIVRKYLSDIEMIIDNFSLTDEPVPFDVIGAERQSYIILRDVAE